MGWCIFREPGNTERQNSSGAWWDPTLGRDWFMPSFWHGPANGSGLFGVCTSREKLLPGVLSAASIDHVSRAYRWTGKTRVWYTQIFTNKHVAERTRPTMQEQCIISTWMRLLEVCGMGNSGKLITMLYLSLAIKSCGKLSSDRGFRDQGFARSESRVSWSMWPSVPGTWGF